MGWTRCVSLRASAWCLYALRMRVCVTIGTPACVTIGTPAWLHACICMCALACARVRYHGSSALACLIHVRLPAACALGNAFSHGTHLRLCVYVSHTRHVSIVCGPGTYYILLLLRYLQK